MGSLRRMITIGVAAAVAALAVPAAHGAPTVPGKKKPVVAASTGNALVGLYPSYNWSTFDTTNDSIVSVFAPPDLGAPLSGTGSYLNAMNAWQGKANSVINFYDGIDANMFKFQVPNIWDTYHAVPMVSMNTGGSTPAQVVAGAADGSIDQFAIELKKWVSGSADVLGKSQTTTRRLYIRFNWEPNGNWYTWAPLNGASSTTTCADLQQREKDYADMWRYVYKRVMDTGLTSNQVGWVFSAYQMDATFAYPQLQSCGAAADIITSIYPGDAYVDWVGIDGYAWCTDDTGTPTNTPQQTFDPMVTKLRSLSTKPMSIDEVGVSTASTIQTTNYVTKNVCSTGAVKGQWIANYFNYLQSAGIKMSMWFNTDMYENTEPIDWAVFALAGPQDIVGNGDSTYTDASTNLTYNAYSEYPAGLASSYWLTPDPTNASVLTDAQFLGQ
jgi:mannan endo-1,4-beta-mannosidase